MKHAKSNAPDDFLLDTPIFIAGGANVVTALLGGNYGMLPFLFHQN